MIPNFQKNPTKEYLDLHKHVDVSNAPDDVWAWSIKKDAKELGLDRKSLAIAVDVDEQFLNQVLDGERLISRLQKMLIRLKMSTKLKEHRSPERLHPDLGTLKLLAEESAYTFRSLKVAHNEFYGLAAEVVRQFEPNDDPSKFPKVTETHSEFNPEL